MTLEVADYIYGLNSSNPPDTDLVQQGDDHLRLIKKVMQQTWPNITGFGLPTSGGSANAQTLTYPYAPTTYSAGQVILFKAGFTNTGAMTINVNGVGAVQVYNTNAALTGGEIIAGVVYMLVYDPAFTGFNIALMPGFGGKTVGNISAPAFLASSNVQVNTPNATTPAWYYALVPGIRQWYWGCNTNGYFYILDASAGNAARLYIDLSGNIVVPGTFNSTTNLGVETSSPGAWFYSTDNVAQYRWGSNGGEWQLFNMSAGGALRLRIDPGGSLILNYGTAYKPGGGSWAVTSDARIKSVSGEYKAGLDELLKLKPVRYTYNGFYHLQRGEKSPHADTKTEYVGLVAQDLEEVFPDMVTKSKGFIGDYEVDDVRQADTSALVYALINAVKTLTARVEALEKEISDGKQKRAEAEVLAGEEQ